MRNMINIVKISLKGAVWTQEQFTTTLFNIIAMEYYLDGKKRMIIHTFQFLFNN